MAPVKRFELLTRGLEIRCSSAELNGQKLDGFITAFYPLNYMSDTGRSGRIRTYASGNDSAKKLLAVTVYLFGGEGWIRTSASSQDACAP